MVKKAPRRNAFYVFMQDFKRREEARGTRFANGYADVCKIADKAWRALPEEEKNIYKKRADDYNKSERRNQGYLGGHTKKKNNKNPPPPLNRGSTLNEEKQRKEKLFIQSLVEKMTINELLDHVFYLIHVNVFCETLDKEFIPAEIAISRFNLRQGVTDVFHRVLNPGVPPLGYSYEIKFHSEKTHRIPLDFVKATKGYLGIFKGITDFLRQGRQDSSGMPQLYTMFDEPFHNCSMSAVKYSMKRIWETSYIDDDDKYDNLDEDELYEKTFQIMSLPILFFYLRNKCALILEDNAVAFENTSEANIKLLNDRYEFNEELACQFHKEIDNVRYCSQSYTVRWAQVIREQCLKNLDSDDEGEGIKEERELIIKKEKIEERLREKDDLSEIRSFKTEYDIKKEKDNIKIEKENDDKNYALKKEKGEARIKKEKGEARIKKEKGEAQIKKEKEEKYCDMKKEKDEMYSEIKKEKEDGYREIKKEKEDGYREIKKEKSDVKIKFEKDGYSRSIKLERDHDNSSRRDRDNHRSYDDVRVKSERDDRHRHFDEVSVKEERDDRHRYSEDVRLKRERNNRDCSNEDRYDFDTVLKTEHINIPFEPDTKSYDSRDSRDSNKYFDSPHYSHSSRETHRSDDRDSNGKESGTEYLAAVKTELSDIPIEGLDCQDYRSSKGTHHIEVKIECSETPIKIKLERPDSGDSLSSSETPRTEYLPKIKTERPDSYGEVKTEDVNIPFDDQEVSLRDSTVEYPATARNSGSVFGNLHSTLSVKVERPEMPSIETFPMPISIKTEFPSKTNRSQNEAGTSKDSDMPLLKTLKVEKDSDMLLLKSIKIEKDSNSDLPIPMKIEVDSRNDVSMPIKIEKDAYVCDQRYSQSHRDDQSDKNVFPMPIPIKMEKSETSKSTPARNQPIVENPRKNYDFPLPMKMKIEKDVEIKELSSRDPSTPHKRTRNFINLLDDSDDAEPRLSPSKIKKERESVTESTSSFPYRIKNESVDSYFTHGMKHEEVIIETDDASFENPSLPKLS